MRMKRHLTLSLAGCAASALLALALMGYAPTRVVAVGDVHGAFPELVTILQRASLIDENRQWIGGTTGRMCPDLRKPGSRMQWRKSGQGLHRLNPRNQR